MSETLTKKRLVVLGAGKMGGILLQAFLKSGVVAAENLSATVAHQERAKELARRWSIPVTCDNRAAVKSADIILLGVKPQAVGEVLQEIRPETGSEQLVISVAASVPTGYIEERLPAKVPVVRAMPNTPAMVGAGITGVCAGSCATSQHVHTACKLFETVGRTVTVDEKHMDAVTGLSASGPAFIYIVLESLAEAGVKVGLPRDLATLLAAQTTLGASRVVLETGSHPALLKDAVTTPAGCTIDGILELEEGKLRVTLIKAVVKATQRAKELLFA
ncbi:MAG TPA: pyrroline-5-carboxylate reductase [Terriglobales bacterium]|nr:pyrroline-5-carboxylate reductase [Terriglobales bacterium]